MMHQQLSRRSAIIGALALVLTACGGGSGSNPTTAGATPNSAANPPVSVSDFKLVAYQGDDVLGRHETTFSTVFNQGKPVVLNFFAGQCPPCQGECH